MAEAEGEVMVRLLVLGTRISDILSKSISTINQMIEK
jgi:hypothetical protein